MFRRKIKEGFYALDPKLKPYFLKSLHYIDRIALIGKEHPGPQPLSVVSWAFLKRRNMLRAYEASTFGKISDYIKTKVWLCNLYFRKKYQDVHYLSYKRSRNFRYLFYLPIGFVIGESFANDESIPGGLSWVMSFYMAPKVHWMLQYIAEDTYVKGQDDYFRHDNLQQSIERIMVKGIEQEELDSLSWITLATHFASMQEDEFSYYSFHFAHLKNHQTVGAHSLQPIDTNDAARMFTKQ